MTMMGSTTPKESMPYIIHKLDIWYNDIHCPLKVRRGEYWGLGVFLLQYFALVKMLKILHYNCINIHVHIVGK